MKVMLTLHGPFTGMDPGPGRTLTIGREDPTELADAVVAWVREQLGGSDAPTLWAPVEPEPEE